MTTKPPPSSSVPHPLTRENYLDGLSFDWTHDEFFKQTFRLIPIAIAFLRIVLDRKLLLRLDLSRLTVVDTHLDKLSRMSYRLDLSRLTVVDTAYVDETFNEYHADMVYRIPLRRGGEVYIHIVIEHKSGNDFETIVQVANYVMQIHKIVARKLRKGKQKWKKNTRLSIVIPVIMHHGKQPFTGATQFSDVIQKLPGSRKYQMRMNAILFDLSTMSIESIPRDKDCPELWPILMIMKTVFSKQDVLDHFDEIMAELKPFLDNPHYLYLTRLCVHYVVSSNAQKLDAEDIRKIDTTIHNTVGGTNMTPMTNTIYMSGVTLGAAKERVEGDARSEARDRQRLISVILKSICKNCRVAQVPDDIEEALNRCQDIFVLESLFDDSFECTSLDEFRQKL